MEHLGDDSLAGFYRSTDPYQFFRPNDPEKIEMQLVLRTLAWLNGEDEETEE